MKAILLNQFGGPEVMHIGEVEDPEPGEGQVRIRVVATSVNRADIVQRQGNYPPPKGESEILGLEVAGEVDALGDGVTQWRPGDRVMGIVAGGGYAQFALAYADHLMPVPKNLTMQDAAAISEVYITAWLNLFLIAGLSEEETVLLHGGGGGVNTAGIQICRALAPGIRTAVTASEGKVERVRQLGADWVIDYGKEDFAEVLRSETNGRGADVILDHIGGGYLARNQKALAAGGRLVVIGLMGGRRAELDLGVMMVKRQRIIGSVLRGLPVSEKARATASFREHVLPRIADRTISPLIHKVYPLGEAHKAHQEMERSSHFGKIVLDVAGL
jgi:putative PIG3 family NAD(P)H quinone oxidoreductase